MSDGLRRFGLILGGAVAFLLWYRLFWDPIALVVMLMGAGIAWIWTRIKREPLTASDIIIGATAAIFVVGLALRIAVAVSTNDPSRATISGLLGQGVAFGASLALIHMGVSQQDQPPALSEAPSSPNPDEET